MRIRGFLNSIESSDEPFTELSVELQALWWAKKGAWEKAHDLAQEAGTKEGDWVHAYLHRVEGDLSNASYWYARAGKTVSSIELSKEWNEIVRALFDL